MLNQIQENPFVLNVPITATVAAGGVVQSGNTLIGVAVSGGVSGDTIAVVLAGIVQLTALNTTAFSFGDALYWDSSNTLVTNTSNTNANAFLGYCVLDKTSSGAVVQVFLGAFNRP